MEQIINQYKELTGELPECVKDDIHRKKYVALALNNKIIAIWTRKESMRDHNIEEVDKATGETKVVRNYYGEWERMSQEDVDKLNEANRKFGKISKSTIEKINNNQREIEELEALIARLRVNAKEE